MFNALNGLGGAGQLSKNVYASDASNSALYACFAVVGFFAGTVINALGIRISWFWIIFNMGTVIGSLVS